MYAEVNSARRILTPLLYNEQKVEQKHATRLDAQNFWQEKGDLTLREIQQRFSGLTVLNERSGKKIIHISVNFHPANNQLSPTGITMPGIRTCISSPRTFARTAAASSTTSVHHTT